MKKGKTPLPSILRVVGIVIVITIGINAQSMVKSSKKITKMHYKTANTVQKATKRTIEVAEAIYEPPVENQIPDIGKMIEEPIQEENIEENTSYEEITSTGTSYTTRMTSYYPEESSDCTGSGLCSWDFQTNEYGWYTYQGKLVVATATTYLLNERFILYDGVHTYKYYNEITLNIDGIDYPAIVLDSCGSSMKTDRIDLFVSGSWAVKDTQIIVKQ